MPIQSAGTPAMHGSAASGLTQIAAATVSIAVTDRDQRLGDGEADRARERVDVGRRARDEVAGAGALDGRERQREHAPHEVLAQLGEHLLREHERRAPREPGEDRLRDQEARRARARACRRRLVVVPFCTDCTSAPSSGGPARPAAAAAACRRDHRRRARARWRRAEAPRLRAQLRALGDGQQLAHSSSPRVTMSR